MSTQPKLNDRASWKKIGNVAMFITGITSFLFWLCNGPLRPDPNIVVHGHAKIIIHSGINPDHIMGFGGWFLHSGLLFIAITCLFLSARNQIRWKRQREGVELEKRIERSNAAASPINQLSGRRNNKKKQEEIEVVVKGERANSSP